MAAGEQRLMDAASMGSPEALDAIAEVVETGAGLPALARAVGEALEASVVILDRSSSVMAVACASPEDERAVMAGRDGGERVDLLADGAGLGEMRMRPRSGTRPNYPLARALAALVALELERHTGPER